MKSHPKSKPHRQVPGEPSPSLVQVVGPAQQGARSDRGPRRPRQLAEAGHQVGEDDDLFQQRGLGRVQQQDRHRPPMTDRWYRHDEAVHAERHGAEIDADTAERHHSEQREAARNVGAKLLPVQADPDETLARAPNEVPDEVDGRQAEHETEQLASELRALVHRGDAHTRDRRLEDRQDRVGGAREQREREHDEDLLAERPSVGWCPRDSLRLRELHASKCTGRHHSHHTEPLRFRRSQGGQ